MCEFQRIDEHTMRVFSRYWKSFCICVTGQIHRYRGIALIEEAMNYSEISCASAMYSIL